MDTNTNHIRYIKNNFVERKYLRYVKRQLLIELTDIIEDKCILKKRWLKSRDVKMLLGISNTTLQMLREKNIIPFKKLEGVYYYPLQGIEDMMMPS